MDDVEQKEVVYVGEILEDGHLSLPREISDRLGLSMNIPVRVRLEKRDDLRQKFLQELLAFAPVQASQQAIAEASDIEVD